VSINPAKNRLEAQIIASSSIRISLFFIIFCIGLADINRCLFYLVCAKSSPMSVLYLLQSNTKRYATKANNNSGRGRLVNYFSCRGE
jgi:hypothetical protein